VVATDGRSPRDGRYLENLGWYDPKKGGVNFALKLDRIAYWKDKGAQLSDTVRSLVRKASKQASKQAAG
jgi:small subunit ribosomal protein S16